MKLLPLRLARQSVAGVDFKKTSLATAAIMLYFQLPFWGQNAVHHLDVPFLLHHIYLFPVAILIARMAMSSGTAAANFWMPVYLWLHVDPRFAFWIVLITMGFGFGSLLDTGGKELLTVLLLTDTCASLFPPLPLGATCPHSPTNPYWLSSSACSSLPTVPGCF